MRKCAMKGAGRVQLAPGAGWLRPSNRVAGIATKLSELSMEKVARRFRRSQVMLVHEAGCRRDRELVVMVQPGPSAPEKLHYAGPSKCKSKA